jgi:transmembrane sensor
MPTHRLMPTNTQYFEHLMMQYLSEKISDKEEQILQEMLTADTSLKERYNEIVKTRAISMIPAIESKKAHNYNLLRDLLGLNLYSLARPTLVQYFLRVAAVLVFLLTTSIATYYIYTEVFNTSSQLMSYTTVVPLGSQAKIVLPDGTIAWLNAGTILKYTNQYGKKNRVVEMTGEGYFDVKKDAEKPFLVQTNDIEIKVLGTIFNVQSYAVDPTVEVSLIEGSVEVTTIESVTSQKITLLPNQQLHYIKKSKTMYVSYADVSKSAQWQIGKLHFVDATLEEIAKDLERRFDVQIYFESSDIKDEYYSGSLDLNLPISTLLEYVDVDKKFMRVYNGKMITILNKY